jgi:hypothetical protein
MRTDEMVSQIDPIRRGRPPPIVAALALLILVSCGKALPSASETTPSSVSPSPSEAGTPSSSPTQDPTASWQVLRSTNGQFTIKHPTSWFISPESVNGSLVGFGMGVQYSRGNEGYVADIGVGSWSASDQIDTSCFLLITTPASQPVTVQGVSGVKRTGTFTQCQGSEETTRTEYDFTTNGRNYYFTYDARPGAVPLADFDLMVTATATFSA